MEDGGRADRVLLTGATGFVGRRLWPALLRAGCRVRGVTRSPEAAAREPGREWVRADVRRPEEIRAALEGCRAAFYLVHGMAEGTADYRREEVAAATGFARAAGEAGVERIVYLGGLAPRGEPSEHLASRLEVGEALRAGPVPTLELRASIIIGHGSLSWLIVRDLAARLPAMVLPRWLRSRTQPVAIEDVVVALTRGLAVPLAGSAAWDLPGPEVLSGRDILLATARAQGIPHPWIVEVPVLSPWLSSHWVRFVTRAPWSVARELVLGMESDLLARDDACWERLGHSERIPFAAAAARALAEEEAAGVPRAGAWAAVERWQRGRARRDRAAA